MRENREFEDGSLIDWDEVKHIKTVRVSDGASLARKLRELFEMDFYVKVKQVRRRQMMYPSKMFGTTEIYIIDVYQQV